MAGILLACAAVGGVLPRPAAALVLVSAEVQEPSAGSQMLSAPGDAGILPAAPDRGESPAPPPLNAPPPGGTIEGISTDENRSLTGYFQIPPDPHGAAGPGHVVAVVDSSIRWHAKDGTGETSFRLGRNASNATGSFFEGLNPVNATFDPKVICDQHAGRFVVVTLERQDTARGDPADTSRILIAVSDDSEPAGTWHRMAIDAKVAIGAPPPAVDHWADYPGLAVDEEALDITANRFAFRTDAYGGVRLWILDKAGLYAGGTSAPTLHDPYAGGGTAVTTQPAHVFGVPADSIVTYLVSCSGQRAGVEERVQVLRVDDPLGTPVSTHQYVVVGDIELSVITLPGAPSPDPRS